jgi:hypothetical protein
MFLSEDNYIERIHSFTLQDWKPLLELIPIIETTEKFCEMDEIVKSEDGVLIVPYEQEHAVISLSREITYQIPIIIDFIWTSWDEGRVIVSDENFEFDSIYIPNLCKLITAFVRNDRFCEGALIDVFDSGQMLKILKSIEMQL